MLSIPVVAQTPRFHHLTVNDGMSQGYINAIAQDAQGFMWFGTNDCLNRYDGHEIKVFAPNPRDSLAVRDHVVLSLLDDGSRHLWVGTQQGGARRMDLATYTFQHIPLNEPGTPSGRPESVLRLHKDRNGEIWALTPESILKFDSVRIRLERFSAAAMLGPATFSDLAESDDGTLWIATVRQGLFRIPPDRSGISHVDVALPARYQGYKKQISTLTVDSRGTLWLGYPEIAVAVGRSELLRVAQQADQPLSVGRMISAPSPRRFLEDLHGRLWISTFSGSLLRFDPNHGTALSIQHDPLNPFSISPGAMLALYSDRSGIMWLGSNGNGVNRQASSFERFSSMTLDAPLSIRSIRAIHKDSEGNLWIGGYGVGSNAGLDRIDASGNLTSFTEGIGPWHLPAANVWTIYEDPKSRGGSFWLGTDGGGLLRLDPGRFVASRVSSGELDVKTIRELYRDQRGTLWVGTQRGLMRYDDMSEEFELPKIDLRSKDRAAIEALTSAEVLNILELSGTPGMIWCSTTSGLLCYDPSTGSGTLFAPGQHDRSLKTAYVVSIHEDTMGRVWVATGGAGIARMTLNVARPEGPPRPADVSFEHITTQNGLPNDFVYGILDGDRQDLWISTNRGISRYDPATGGVRSYDVTDGLQNNEFNKNAYHRTADGELFFGGVMGLNRFYPRDLRDNPHTPNVVITAFKLFNEPLSLPSSVSWIDEVTLDHEDRVITLEFVALEYTAPERNRYRYLLEGFDPRWVEAGDSRSTTYTNLEPGEYTFRVTGSNNDGVWNPTGASLRIVVLPPFWKTWWFRTLAAVLVVGALYGGSRYRVRSMEARNRELEVRVRERTAEWESANAELEAFSYTVSHDLRAPVRAINGYTRMLVDEHASTLDPEGQRMLGVIAARTKRMGDMIDDLLTFSRTGRQTIVPARVEMLDIVQSAAHDLIPADGQGRTQVTIGALPPAYGDEALLRQVWVNLISNAVKFSSGNDRPMIEVGGRQEPSGVVYWVRDNGVGFDMTYEHKLFGVFERLHSQEEFEGTGVGLAIAHRVVTRHGGRIWAESEPGKGATFCFFLPHARGSAETATRAVGPGSRP